MILSQQAETLADVVKNDASIQTLKGYGNFMETYRIRGFVMDGDDITFGGLYGVMPRQMVSTNMIERVEVFKGANAFVNGVSGGGVGSGVGGSVNVEPKHAADDALTRATVDYESRGKVGGALDVGRRFGDNNAFGVRVNVLHREGRAPSTTRKSACRWPPSGWIIAAIVSAPRWTPATSISPFTAGASASGSAAPPAFRRRRTPR